MGFRSSFVSEHRTIAWPDWFREKWGHWVHFGEGCISSRFEAKLYYTGVGFEEDVQKVIGEVGNVDSLWIVFFHECHGVSRCCISRNAIEWSEPDGWCRVDDVTHYYCWRCSVPYDKGEE